MIASNEWIQISFADSNGLSGESVRDFVSFVVSVFESKWVGAFGLSGSYSGLRDMEGGVMTSSDFLRRVADAVQYDWAWFYLNTDKFVQGKDERSDLSLIENSEVTIRLADSNLFYIYSKKEHFMEKILDKYPGAEKKECHLGDLEILY